MFGSLCNCYSPHAVVIKYKTTNGLYCCVWILDIICASQCPVLEQTFCDIYMVTPVLYFICVLVGDIAWVCVIPSIALAYYPAMYGCIIQYTTVAQPSPKYKVIANFKIIEAL